jgi:hypothetical protein
MSESENNETIADIVAEMRKMKRYAQSDSSDCRYVAYWCYQTFADRIEAAWKREEKAIATENAVLPAVCITKSVGNAAALRDALAKIWDKQWSILPKNKSEDETLSEIITIIEEALSEPPRNCDRFKTKEEAEIEFSMSDELPRNNGDLKMREWMCRFTDWLFATAAERKGENNGK